MAENKHADEFDNLLKGYNYIKLRIIQQAAGIALAFFKASFTNQGFTDAGLVKWKKRIPGTPNDKGRAIEINRGILKRSIRIKKASIDGAIVGPDDGIPYAEIQNFGGKIPITPQMRRFFWAMYYQAQGGKQYNVKTKSEAHTKRNSTLNDTANFWKNMALTKEQFLTIPARQFIGNSITLERDIKNYVTSELNKFFKVE
jgi:phage gpG-like protein